MRGEIPRRGRRGAVWLAAAISAATLGADIAGAQNAIAPSQGAAGIPSADSGAPSAAKQIIDILFVRQRSDRAPPLSLLDIPPKDDGLAGAKLAVADNNTTGRFVGQEFRLETLEGETTADIVSDIQKRLAQGPRHLIMSVSPETLLAVADAVAGQGVLLLNVGASDDRLREEDCRANVMHIAPTRAMLADALAQYLVWKQWRRWFLILGPSPDDQAAAEAYRRAAKRFGAKIVEERVFQDEGGSRRADGGHEQVQLQIPVFTQGAAAHDVVVVADEGDLFGEYIPFRTWEARPVVGAAGLTPMSWHPAMEQWGATQFQDRFRKLANRAMRPSDYDAWLAVRAVGEAATRRKSARYEDIVAYLHAPEFEVAGFKGQKLTFRSWNGQLRQPIILGTPKLPVTVSPQPGFLHQFSELDTLGFDRPETKCKM